MDDRTNRLIPYLISLGPLWMVLFMGAEQWIFRVVGYLGAIALGVGLVLIMSMVYHQQREIEWLKQQLKEDAETGRYDYPESTTP